VRAAAHQRPARPRDAGPADLQGFRAIRWGEPELPPAGERGPGDRRGAVVPHRGRLGGGVAGGLRRDPDLRSRRAVAVPMRTVGIAPTGDLMLRKTPRWLVIAAVAFVPSLALAAGAAQVLCPICGMPCPF